MPFEDLLKLSDFLIISAAQTSESVGKFDKNVFKMMKNDSILVNVSRLGEILRNFQFIEVLLSTLWTCMKC